MSELTARRHEYRDLDDLQEDYVVRGWTDGLPIVAPTPEKVLEFLAAGGIAADASLGTMPSREIEVFGQEVAINAVMAGCRPEYMPVVVAAVRALLHPDHIAHSTTATLAGPAQVVIVNGPVRIALDVACEQGCFGPGFRANATIGRAVRLVVRNTLRAVPGGLDRAAFSTPGRYSFCFGENEEDSPWTPLHVERGFDPAESTVTVHSALNPLVVNPESDDPGDICDAIVAWCAQDTGLWQHMMGRPADVVLVIGSEHQRMFRAQAWDKSRVREAVFQRLVAHPGPPGHEGDLRIESPDGILIVAAGGPAVDWSVVLPAHLGRAITEPIRFPS